MTTETSIGILFLLVGILYIITIISYILIKRAHKKINEGISARYIYLNRYIDMVKQYHDKCIEKITDQQDKLLNIVEEMYKEADK